MLCSGSRTKLATNHTERISQVVVVVVFPGLQYLWNTVDSLSSSFGELALISKIRLPDF